jgi:hypothetical protein
MNVKGPFRNAREAEDEAQRLRDQADVEADPKRKRDCQKFARQFDLEAERLRGGPSRNARKP